MKLDNRKIELIASKIEKALGYSFKNKALIKDLVDEDLDMEHELECIGETLIDNHLHKAYLLNYTNMANLKKNNRLKFKDDAYEMFERLDDFSTAEFKDKRAYILGLNDVINLSGDTYMDKLIALIAIDCEFDDFTLANVLEELLMPEYYLTQEDYINRFPTKAIERYYLDNHSVNVEYYFEYDEDSFTHTVTIKVLDIEVSKTNFVKNVALFQAAEDVIATIIERDGIIDIMYALVNNHSNLESISNGVNSLYTKGYIEKPIYNYKKDRNGYICTMTIPGYEKEFIGYAPLKKESKEVASLKAIEYLTNLNIQYEVFDKCIKSYNYDDYHYVGHSHDYDNFDNDFDIFDDDLPF